MRHKKSYIIVVVLLLLIAAAVPPLVIWWHRIFPSHEVSELYSRYENVDGVEASFVKDFRVNDTLFVDVTLLQATTDSAWAILRKELKVPELTTDMQKGLDSNSPTLAFGSLPDTQKEGKSNALHNESNTFVITIYNDCLITVLEAKTKEQKELIFDSYFEKYLLNNI